MSSFFYSIHESSNFSVSAIIAVYNPKPDMLRQAVLSVLGQTMPVLELVLVNDGGSILEVYSRFVRGTQIKASWRNIAFNFMK